MPIYYCHPTQAKKTDFTCRPSKKLKLNLSPTNGRKASIVLDLQTSVCGFLWQKYETLSWIIFMQAGIEPGTCGSRVLAAESALQVSIVNRVIR